MADEIKTQRLPKHQAVTLFIHLLKRILPRAADLRAKGTHPFPPEPNGYLHIGHAKAICIDFGTAEKFGGICNLRMDDTNPTKEDVEYVDAIKEDIKWLGFDWDDRFYYASEYFDQMYDYAVELIKRDLHMYANSHPNR